MNPWTKPGDPTRRCRRGESMFALLCGDDLLDHPRGSMPECLRVARSRAHALANLPLHPGMCGEFWGGPATTHLTPYAIVAFPREGRDDKASFAAYHDTTRSFKVGEACVGVKVSFGTASCPRDGVDAEALLQAAHSFCAKALQL